MKILIFLTNLLFISIVHSFQFNVGDKIGETFLIKNDKFQDGTFAFIAPEDKKFIEINKDGEIVFRFDIDVPRGYLKAGADVEWLPETKTFLVVIPRYGLFELDREKGKIWECKTPFISHDADLLSDNTIVFVNGWDDIGKNEPIYTHIDRDCNILKELYAEDLELDKTRYKDSNNPLIPASDTHTNAVQIIDDEHMILSIRNYSELVMLKNFKPIWRMQRKSKKIHDPVVIDTSKPIEEFEFYFANRRKGHQLMKVSYSDPDNPVSVWNSKDAKGESKYKHKRSNRFWTPLRTVEILPNKNILLTGSKAVGQVTSQGELVWDLRITQGFKHQEHSKNFIFKVAFIPK